MADLQRGDVVAMTGHLPAQQRLAVVVQGTAFAGLPSVLICPVTETEVDAPLLRIWLTPTDALSLPQPVWVMAELVTAVPREAIGVVIGRVSQDDLRQLDRSLIAILGLA